MQKTDYEPNQEQVVRIGFELLPLYKMLFKFKVYEYCLADPTCPGDRNVLKMHPIYKEIRETVKTINQVWKDINGGRVGNLASDQHGEPEFSEALMGA